MCKEIFKHQKIKQSAPRSDTSLAKTVLSDINNDIYTDGWTDGWLNKKNDFGFQMIINADEAVLV